MLSYESGRYIDANPSNFRLRKDLDGENILQGEYRWTSLYSMGSEWRDIEVVVLDEEGNGEAVKLLDED